jgi:hypothetical protein
VKKPRACRKKAPTFDGRGQGAELAITNAAEEEFRARI